MQAKHDDLKHWELLRQVDVDGGTQAKHSHSNDRGKPLAICATRRRIVHQDALLYGIANDDAARAQECRPGQDEEPARTVAKDASSGRRRTFRDPLVLSSSRRETARYRGQLSAQSLQKA